MCDPKKTETILRSELDKAKHASERLPLMMARIEALQGTHIAAFVDSRPQLAARFGIGGMAALMDHFSAAERLVNRAWTAACDGHEGEAMASLKAARPLLDAPLARLKAATP